MALSAVLVANIAGLVALVAVYALVRVRLAPAAAILAVAIVALQPGAVAFAMAYPDSLFLLLVCACLLAGELKTFGIPVNAVCPGWCRTDMGGAEAPRTATEGADTAVWLATEAPRSITGRFFRDRQEIPW